MVSDALGYAPASVSAGRIEQYINLFRRCFPKASVFSREYLAWLYGSNPSGPVVGFDAIHSDEVVAHYACVPADVYIGGVERRMLLSLNTATHPAFQGRGLFTKLAEATYSAAADDGFVGVYGVANANSTPGFVRKLGFQLVGPLDAKIGVGSLLREERRSDATSAAFMRAWRPETLAWRISSPARKFRFTAPEKSGVVGVYARTDVPLVHAWDEVDFVNMEGHVVEAGPIGLKLHLGLIPASVGGYRKTWYDVPDRIRTSPLNLIVRRLDGSAESVCRREVCFGVLDFDAF